MNAQQAQSVLDLLEDAEYIEKAAGYTTLAYYIQEVHIAGTVAVLCAIADKEVEVVLLPNRCPKCGRAFDGASYCLQCGTIRAEEKGAY
jgi:predicted Zn-ribbon and HTH transcriptional regulator